MVAHDMRYILLGLFCLVEIALCRTCVSQFDDIKSRALASDIVLEGRVISQTRLVNGRYNATIKAGRKKIFKGAIGTERRSQYKFTVADFGKERNAELCSAPVDIGKSYIFFLSRNSEDPSNVYRIARLPDKNSKKYIRDIKKILCKKCAKAPVIRKINAITVKQGKKIVIKCKVSANPKPTIAWFKAGEEIKKRKGLKIKTNKRGSQSTLKISKASAKDAGVYTCRAVNQLGETQREGNVTVLIPEPEVTTLSHTVMCDDHEQLFCLNGGTCHYIPSLKEKFCRCAPGYTGERCGERPPRLGEGKEMEKELIEKKKHIVIMGIVIGVLALAVIALVICFVTRRRRSRRQKHSVEERAALNSYMRQDDVDHLTPKAGQGDIPMKTFRHELQRATSTTQTEPVQIGPVNFEDFIPQAEAHLRLPSNRDQRMSTTSTGSRRLSRKRISGISHTPGTSREQLDDAANSGKENDQIPPADDDLECNSLSQSSKTESCQPAPGSKESSPGSRRRANGVSDDDDNTSSKSEYDNDDLPSPGGMDEIDSPKVVVDNSLSAPSFDPKKLSNSTEYNIYKTPNDDQVARNQLTSPLLGDSRQNHSTGNVAT